MNAVSLHGTASAMSQKMRIWVPLFLGVFAGALLSHVIAAQNAHACSPHCETRGSLVLEMKSVEGSEAERAKWASVGAESGALLTSRYLVIAVEQPQGQVEVELAK